MLHVNSWGRWMLFVVLALVWGSSFILMKWSKAALSGVEIGAMRIFAAGLFFLPAAIVHFKKLPRSKRALVALSGLLGNLIPAFLFGLAIAHQVDSALAGILNSLTPLFVLVIAPFFGTRFSKQKLAGVLIGLIGLSWLSISRHGISAQNLPYASLIFLATFSYGLNINVVTHHLKGLNALHMASVSLALMAIPAGVVLLQHHTFSLFWNDAAARWPIGAAALLGVMGSAVATVLFYQLVEKAGGVFASLVTYAIPVVAIGWGLFAGEKITVIQLVCLAIILSGVYLVNRPANNTKKAVA